MFTTVRIGRHERGLWFHHGDFKGLILPGEYRLWSQSWSEMRDRIDVVDTLRVPFEHECLDTLMRDASLRDELLVFDLDDRRRALLWQNDRLAHILGPGRHTIWRAPFRVEVEALDVGRSLRDELSLTDLPRA